jgi:cytochrome c553
MPLPRFRRRPRTDQTLKDYRSGARKDEMMSLVMRNLKDGNIADLAAYYAAIPITIGPPRQ